MLGVARQSRASIWPKVPDVRGEKGAAVERTDIVHASGARGGAGKPLRLRNHRLERAGPVMYTAEERSMIDA